MNPKNLNIRMDRENGDFWLVEDRYQPGKPRKLKRVCNMTGPFLLAFCADLLEVEHTQEVVREVKFPDGRIAKITAIMVPPEEDETPDREEHPLPPKI